MENELIQKEKINPDFDLEGIGIVDIWNEVSNLTDYNTTEITGEKLLLSEVEKIPCLVDPILQQTGIGCLAGGSDVGKSSLLRQLAIAIVTGQKDFLGFPINVRRNSVIYVSSEDLEQETAFLLKKQSREFAPDQLRELRFVFDIENLLEELDKRLTSKPADLVIIDCFADIFGGDLKDTQKIRTSLHKYQELAVKHDALIFFIHHVGKRTENFEPNKNNLLSGQGFEAKLRIVIELRADTLTPSHRHLCIVKGNYLSGNYKKESYVLEFDEPNFTFTNTGERTPFELLSKQSESDNGKAKFERALELKNQGFSFEKIAREIGYQNKSSITKLFDKAEKFGWGAVSSTVSTVSTGNAMETPR